MTDNYINFVAVEEAFNLEKASIQADESLDYPTKRMLVNELDRVWHYILQTPIRKIVSADPQPVEQWISVENRFPNDGERVNVYTVDKRVLEMTFDKCRERWNRMDVYGLGLFGQYYVTHWQPLPEPPKEG